MEYLLTYIFGSLDVALTPDNLIRMFVFFFLFEFFMAVVADLFKIARFRV